jgi:DNA-binding response OmpR family regulator
MWPWWKKTIADISPKLPLAELRKRARVLVIDDDSSAFPHKLLAKEGYNVTYWKSLENLRDLESGEYDIIVLDIHGIATPEVSATGGLGVLSHIKKYNPAQIIIAYSGHKYDLRNADFWNIADDYLGKPSSLLDCKQKIDSLLERKFTAHYYANVLKTLLREKGVTEKQIGKLEQAIVTARNGGQLISPEKISTITGIAKNVASTAWVIITVILRLLHPAVPA